MSVLGTILPDKYLVSPAVKKYRQRVCEKCPFYKKGTDSCGTFLVGGAVEYRGAIIELCGCKISEKSELQNHYCPARKW